MEHCCDIMDYFADPTYKKNHEVIIYHSETRRYNLVLHGYDFGMERPMCYCPWCGKKLPKKLGEEWCKIIKENFGLDDVFAEEWATLPEEYKTDEWWKKRGL
ncbi:MAG: hypothetical protein LN561_00815 [Rickettsia endosymbiont of Labidopullus appendiculatus]|nr:hypothetical protein [Rickettsia endosymbiont of Labidopullus appendiculatus]